MNTGAVLTCGAHDVRPVLLSELQEHLPHKALSSLYQTTQYQAGNQPQYHPPYQPKPDQTLLKNILSVTEAPPLEKECQNKKVSFNDTVTEYCYKGKKLTKNYVQLHFHQINIRTPPQLFFPYDFSGTEIAKFNKKG